MNIILLFSLICIGAATPTVTEETIQKLGYGTRVASWVYTPVFTDCGGIVPISTIGNTIINYKNSSRFDVHEFCVWTILPHKNMHTIQVTVEQGLNLASDGIVAYTWDRSNLLSSQKFFGSNQVYNFTTPVFLAFSSDWSPGVSGISIRIIGLGSPGGRISQAYHFDTDEGEFSYPQVSTAGYGLNELVSVVVQGQTSSATKIKEMQLKNVDVESGYDFVYVYTLLPYHADKQFGFIERFTGNLPNQVLASTTDSLFPNLYIFTSDFRVNGKGFTIAWKTFSSRN